MPMPTFARGRPPPPDGPPRPHSGRARRNRARPFFRDKAGGARHGRAMFLLERNDAYARLTLNRPEARNAIPAAEWRVLTETLGRVETSDVRLLVVTGAGGTFCAGADLTDFNAMRADPAAIATFRTDMRASH